MTAPTITRRLVAIFYADVAGYSRLTGADEVGTHRRVMAMLDDVTARIGEAGGQVLRYAGDAILAVFPSVVLAVDTAAAIQLALAEREAGSPEDERVAIRIGINLGDVIEDRGEVYGEGVNLAARLEAAAEPGGICISAAAHDQCRRKTVLAFRDGGEQQFKNIERPMRVFHWTPGALSRSEAKALAVITDKPSIAVLPFNNMSGDPEQEYFSDGITEDLITELSRGRSLFVIARNSSFVFKGRNVDIKEVGQRLGVTYVVEGSVRRVGDRVRITAQLIDVSTGSHIWADRYDRDLDDIFAVQDEVTERVTHALIGNVTRVEVERSRQHRLVLPAAYDLVLQAADLAYSQFTEGFHYESIHTLLDEATRLDPDWGRPLSWKALAYFMESFNVDQFERLAPKTIEVAQRALSLRSPEDWTDAVIASIVAKGGDLHSAEVHLARALIKNPANTTTLAIQGYVYIWHGKAEEARRIGERALRLDPLDPLWLRDLIGYACYLTEDYEAAYDHLSRFDPAVWTPDYAYQAACLGQLGRSELARAKWAKAVELIPRFSPAKFLEIMGFREPAYRAHWLDGLKKAGITE